MLVLDANFINLASIKAHKVVHNAGPGCQFITWRVSKHIKLCSMLVLDANFINLAIIKAHKVVHNAGPGCQFDQLGDYQNTSSCAQCWSWMPILSTWRLSKHIKWCTMLVLDANFINLASIKAHKVVHNAGPGCQFYQLGEYQST